MPASWGNDPDPSDVDHVITETMRRHRALLNHDIAVRDSGRRGLGRIWSKIYRREGKRGRPHFTWPFRAAR